MEKIRNFCRKQIVFTVSFLAALVSLIISPPTGERFLSLDWQTLFTLFMLLLVLEGFKKENMFLPFFRLTERFNSVKALSFFLVGTVFFLAPFITNDVSLVTFVPLTIMIFRHIGKEKHLLEIVILENIAAITGAFLTPFGNPQNLFIYTNVNVSASSFIIHMVPMWITGMIGLAAAICFVFRKDGGERIYTHKEIEDTVSPERRGLRVFYLFLLILLLVEIITRVFNFVDITLIVLALLLVFDRKVFLKVDYCLLSTFFFFFLFSSSIGENGRIGEILSTFVSGNEYWWGLGVSQIISNVPGTALLLPFSTNYTALLYGVNAAGMGTIVGSLASLITFSIYIKNYPEDKKRFLKYFHLFSMCFLLALILVALPIQNWQL